MQVDLQVEVPKGYELTGEYRFPDVGEWFLNSCHCAKQRQAEDAHRVPFISRLILRKVDTWRDATLDDLKRVMDGEVVECRYIDGPRTHDGFRLAGWNTNSKKRPVWAMLMKEDPSGLYYASQVQVKE